MSRNGLSKVFILIRNQPNVIMIKKSILLTASFLMAFALNVEAQPHAEKPAKVESAADAGPFQITEWLVPWEGRPRDPFVAPDGNIFFVGQRQSYVGHLNISTGEFKRFDLDEGTGPHNVIVAPDGTPWYAGNLANHIGKLDVSTGEITKYMMPEDMSARDPHTLIQDKNGNIWFSSQGANSIGHFNVTTGEAEIMPVERPRSRPYGVVMAPDMERPWYVLFGTNRLATVDPATMTKTEIDLPREETRPRRLAVTSDGMVWYNDYAKGMIGRYNPNDGTFKEWAMPEGEGSRPYAMASDDQGRVWVVATGIQPNRFVGFDPATETFFASQEVPSGGGTVRHMVYDEATKSIWFGTDTNYIGRATFK